MPTTMDHRTAMQSSNENELESARGREPAGKPGETTVQHRAVLGNLSNNLEQMHVQNEPKQTEAAVVSRPFTRSRGMSNVLECSEESQIHQDPDPVGQVEPIELEPVEPIAVEPVEPIAVEPVEPIAVEPVEPIEVLNSDDEDLSSIGALSSDDEQQLSFETEPSAMETFDIYNPTLPLGVPDIDAGEMSNPQLVAVYIKPIYAYLYSLENEYEIKPGFLRISGQLNSGMRAVLIDWLFQVHQRFKLLQETLYLAFAIMDRFLQATTCKKKELQLVGVTSLLVASKYEEMYSPELQDFVYITDSAYTKSEVLEMEQRILMQLGFNLGRPLHLHFLRRFSKAWEVDAQKHTLAKYLMMVSQTEYKLAHVTPSRLAAAALLLSAKLLTDTPWDDTMRFYSRYSEHQLLPVVCTLARLAQRNYLGLTKQKAVCSFFGSSKHMFISQLTELDSDAARSFADRASELADQL